MITKKPDSNLSFLYRAVLMLKTEEECERFFDDLCTGPELKAIAQRLEVAKLLKEQNMQSTGQGQSDFPYRFYVSDLAEKFKGFANSILPFDVEKTQKIDIEKY